MAGPHFVCFGSMGTPYGFGGFNRCHGKPDSGAEGWTEAECIQVAERVANLGFRTFIPWTDGPPGTVSQAGDRGAETDVSGLRATYEERVRRVVDAAHERGVDVHLYFAVGPVAVVRMDEHELRAVHTHAIGRQFPGCYTVRRDGSRALEGVLEGKEKLAFAGLGFAEIRSALSANYVDMVAHTRADGLQLEPVAMPLDIDGVSELGYEAPSVEAFRTAAGRSPFEVPNGDPRWIAARCGFTTDLALEVRDRLSGLGREATLSTVGYTLDDDRRYLWPWREWVQRGLLDAFYCRTKATPDGVATILKARDLCRETGISYTGCFDIKSYDGRPTDCGLLAECLSCLMDAGLERIGIYGLRLAPLALNPFEVDPEVWTDAMGRCGNTYG